MNSLLSHGFVLAVALLFCTSHAYAQATGTDESEASPTDERPIPNSQEVEVNEDVYRQFMELRNKRQQRNMLPEEAFKPSSGSQKLDELPEESQKHLRNQLREIIVQGAPWEPGDENRNYPYVPSTAAVDNQQLQKQEAEAWGELLDSYHKREAQIYENSARTAAARASEDAMNSSSPGAGGSQNSSRQGGGQVSDGETSEAQKQAENQSRESNKPPNTSKITSSTGTAGVSQNAMEFLNRMGNTGGPVDSDNQAESGNNEDTGTESGTGGPLKEPTEIAQQDPADQNVTADQPSDTSPNDPNAASLAGTSQNALEFLNKNDAQDGGESEKNDGTSPGESDNPGEAGEELAQSSSSQTESTDPNAEDSVSSQDATNPTAGASQNALEYLSGEQPPTPAGQESNGANPTNLNGTLSIEDLVNARGVGVSRNPTPPGNTGGGQQPGVKPPEEKKDDG